MTTKKVTQKKKKVVKDKVTKDKPNSIIYGLYDDGKLLYVGSTSHIGKRYKEHLEALRADKSHPNKTLQKYCDDNKVVPTIEVLHTCQDDTRIRKWIAELVCIDLYRPICNKPILQYNFRTMTNMGFPKVPFDKVINKLINRLMDIFLTRGYSSIEDREESMDILRESLRIASDRYNKGIYNDSEDNDVDKEIASIVLIATRHVIAKKYDYL